jgi:hypothetical protein
MLKSRFTRQRFSSFLDLAPILAVVLIFQILIIGKPVPDVASLITGTLLVILGLTLFIQGLEQSLFPLGEAMAYALRLRIIIVALSVGFAILIGVFTCWI